MCKRFGQGTKPENKGMGVVVTAVRVGSSSDITILSLWSVIVSYGHSKGYKQLLTGQQSFPKKRQGKRRVRYCLKLYILVLDRTRKARKEFADLIYKKLKNYLLFASNGCRSRRKKIKEKVSGKRGLTIYFYLTILTKL